MSFVELQEVVEILRNGASIKQSDSAGGTPITRIETIANWSVNPERCGYADVSEDDFPNHLMQDGDILISHINSTKHLGKCAMYKGVPEKLIHGMNLLGLRVSSDIAYPDYIYRVLCSPQFRKQLPKITKNSVNQSSFTVTNFKTLKFPLPPLKEQKRIAAILDKADAIRRKRQQAIDLTDQLLRSVFLDMFGDPVTNPKGWDKQPISQLSERVTKGESPKWQGFDYQDTGVRFVTSENVLWGKLDDRNKFIPEEFHKKLTRSALKEEDLLMNLVGASVGRACLVPIGGIPANINQAVAVTTLSKEKIVPEFLLAQILTVSMQRKLLGNAVDAARANVSLTNIRELEVIVPSIEQQKAYLNVVNKVNKLKYKHENSNELFLFESLTQQAFNGKLIKQPQAA